MAPGNVYDSSDFPYPSFLQRDDVIVCHTILFIEYFIQRGNICVYSLDIWVAEFIH